MDSVDSPPAKSRWNGKSASLGMFKTRARQSYSRIFIQAKTQARWQGYSKVATYPPTWPHPSSGPTQVLTQGAQGHVTMGLEWLQGWRLHDVSGQPVSDQPQGQKVFFYVSRVSACACTLLPCHWPHWESHLHLHLHLKGCSPWNSERFKSLAQKDFSTVRSTIISIRINVFAFHHH